MNQTVTRTSTTEEVVTWLKTQAALFKDAETNIVGAWVWVEFKTKPAAEVRRALCDAGFHWIAKRGKWAHACGVKSRSSKNDPFATYGAEEVEL